LYSSLNRAVSSKSTEGAILLRVSKLFTAIFAIFMGFLAVFLQTLGFSLGWVYMSMGVIIGSAVGPASLTILMETANGIWIGAGAVGGLALGLMGWIIKAQVDSGEVTYDTLGSDWPWVVGNLCAIIGGFVISLVGSLAFPDKTFKWSMLNERIPLVDDIEPPKDSDESESKLELQVKIAVLASLVLTFVLLVLWPLPMYGSAGVFSKGGFGVWVGLEMVWAIIGGIVIVTLPVFETVRSFQQARKQAAEVKEKVKSESATLKDGVTMLKIDIDAGAEGAKAASI
jgi:MFS family permease